jgi:hypothetical protein
VIDYPIMTPEQVEKLTLVPGKLNDTATGEPCVYTVCGLPPHLKAEIKGGQSGYKYHLTRERDNKYEQKQASPSDAAFQALKDLLNWDPVPWRR